ncbi:MAG: hypothetical protein HN392_04245 [Anaerolineae bacterium]|nr:hypothetical protein [Anaerolineae bacterium]MBT7781921.1 hypothetical protein [Anaerolineae bacterium]
MGDWEKINVPACWQAEGHDYNGVAWYRTTFPRPFAKGIDNRAWLQFKGVDYTCDVWLNGRCLGSHEGYFGQFGFEISSFLQEQNVLAIRVDAPRGVLGEEDELWQNKNMVKGALERWDVSDPTLNPGGIWNDVEIVVSGSARIARTKIQAQPSEFPPIDRPNDPVRAVVAVEFELDLIAGSVPTEYEIDIELLPVGDEKDVAVDENQGRVRKTVSALLFPGTQTERVIVQLDQARLWWTWDLGTPQLYRLSLCLRSEDGVSDRMETRFGIRQIEQREGSSLYLNNIRFFQRGANYLSDQLLSRMTHDRYKKDLALVKEANLNTIHPFCILERQIFYDQCDEEGVLVYQDFPMWMTMSNESEFVRRAVAQVAEMTEQFGHHPSIAIWNMGSQPSPANFEKLNSALVYTVKQADPSRIVKQGNASVAFEGNPVHSHGSFFWDPALLEQYAQVFDWRSDLHLYFGWYMGEKEDLAQMPDSYYQLVTEFGAQSLPRKETLEKIIGSDDLFPPDWKKLSLHCAQEERLIERAGDFKNIDELIMATQQYQAELVRYHIEFYRRRKFKPCNGAHVFCFNDCWPAVTWSLVEFDRTPKLAYEALKRSMAPLQVFIDLDRLSFQADENNSLKLCIVNDLQKRYNNVSVRVIVSPTNMDGAADVNLVKERRCDIPPSSLIDLAPLEWLPKTTGKYHLDLSVYQDDDVLTRNEYVLDAVEDN